jgi:hypothetical protein
MKLFASFLLFASTLQSATPLIFEKNPGPGFLARGTRYSALITPAGAAISLHGHAVTLTLQGANPHARPEPLDPTGGVSNYLHGQDPSHWTLGVPHYAKVRVPNVRPGIDLLYYGKDGDLEYDIALAPGVAARSLPLDIQGADSLTLNEAGDLVIHSSAGDLTQHRPLATQGARHVDVTYAIRNPHEVDLRIGAHDPKRPLTIDPVVTYSAVIGGSGNDSASAIALDGSGSTYIAGTTASPDFPGAKGFLHGATDAFVLKLNAAGTAIQYATYLGGSLADAATGIAADSAGNAYITGVTYSLDFPIFPAGGFPSLAGQTAFAVKLGPTGAPVYSRYSRYFGGTAGDNPTAIAVDSTGNAYLTGRTGATNFPVTNSTLSPPTFSQTAFAAKLTPTGAIAYATYLGGTYGDTANAIAVDGQGNAYIAGSSIYSSFPATAGAYQTSVHGSRNAFVAKLNPAGSAFVYATLLGGSQTDEAFGIAIDSSGSAYVTGTTNSPDFPTTAGAANAAGAFVTKLNPSGSALVYSTYLGGSGHDNASAIAVDSSGSAYVYGRTSSPNFPTTAGALRTQLGTTLNSLLFLTKLNAAGSVAYSTFVGDTFAGSTQGSQPGGLQIDNQGGVYLAGLAAGSAFPVTPGALSVPQSKIYYAGPSSAFVTKIDFSSAATCGITMTPPTATISGAGGGSSFTINSPAGCPYEIAQDAGVTLPGETSIDGFGNRTLQFSVGFNNTPAPLTYHVYALGTGATPGSNVFTITQALGCSATVIPGPANLPAIGGTGYFQVAVSDPTCNWAATPDSPWVTITSSTPTVGAYSVAPNNTTQARTAVIGILNRTFTVTQAAGSLGVGGSTFSILSPVIGPNGSGFSGDGGPALNARYTFGGSLATDGLGNLYIADGLNNRIRKVDTNGIITTFAGGGPGGLGDGGPPTQATFDYPTGVAADSAGNVYITDDSHNRVRKVSNNVITTIAGTGIGGDTGDGGPATAAQLYGPNALWLDPFGNLYVAENYRIRKIDKNGMISTLAMVISDQLSGDAAGNLYTASSFGGQVFKITPSGTVTLVAGDGHSTSIVDGAQATQTAVLGSPGIALDANGNLLIAEQGGVYRVTSDGIIHSISTFLSPFGGFISDGAGNFYEEDTTGALYRVGQKPVTACSYTANLPASLPQSSLAQVTIAKVTTQSTCQWSATSLTPWIQVSTVPQTGTGTVNLTLAANPGTTARTGTVIVAGQVTTVTQHVSNASPDSFVTSIYQDIFGRAPDAAGLAYWSGQISSGALTRAQLVAVFFTSLESLSGEYYVAKLYPAMYGQLYAPFPDYAGWLYWTGQAESLGTPSVVQAFYPKSQFVSYTDNATFLGNVYLALLGRFPDNGGNAYYLGQLNAGTMTRAQVIDAFVRGAEYDAIARPGAYASLMYLALLRRAPDAAGWLYWTSVLKDPNNLTGVIATFLNSQEYQLRF